MDHLSGGDILIRALKDAKVKYIWGYPGGAAGGCSLERSDGPSATTAPTGWKLTIYAKS